MKNSTKNTTKKTTSHTTLCRVKFVYIPSSKTNIDKANAQDVTDRQDFGRWIIYQIIGNKKVNLGSVNGGHTHEELEWIADSVCNRIESFEYDVRKAK